MKTLCGVPELIARLFLAANVFLLSLFLILSCACDRNDEDSSSTGTGAADTSDDTAADDVADDADDDSDDDSGDDALDDSTDDSMDDTADDTGDDTESDDDSADDDTVPPISTTVSGLVYRFDPSFTLLEGASISVVERPDLEPVITDAGGAFTIGNVHAGDELSLLSTHDAFYPTQSATVIVPEEGLDDLTIQTPPRLVVRLLALTLLTSLDPDMCQIAVTVSEAGSTPFSPGIAGAVVSIDPPLAPEHGPFYFDYIDLPNLPPIDIPLRGLTETTDDGGAVFINVPPGDYVLTASSDEDEFTPALVRCRAGVLVNACPPYGLQTVEP